MKTPRLLYAAVLLASSAQANADRLADPTRPSREPRAASDGTRQLVRVEAIFRSAERQLAIVNGKVVRAGDHVSGVLIEEILHDGVRYVRDGQVHTARLRPAAISVRQAAESGR
jgi:hypothetical protein